MTNQRPSISVLLRSYIAVIILAFLLSSCGIIIINRPDEQSDTGDWSTGEQTTDGTTVTTKVPKSTEDKKKMAQYYVDNLPDYDMKNMSILISAVDKKTLIIDDEDNSLSKARHRRYSMLEKKYGVNIIVTSNDVDTIFQELKDSIASGMYYADLLMLPSESVGSFYAGNYLLNIMSLPYVFLDEPYFNEESVLQSTAGYNVYAVSGDAVLNPDYIYGVFFNFDLAARLDMGNPYELVYKGEWTWDVYRAMAKAIAYDLNGIATGIGGHGAQSVDRSYSDMVLGSTGIKYLSTGWGQMPVLNEPGEQHERISALLYSLLYEDKTLYKRETHLEAFANKGLLFYTGPLLTMHTLSDSAARWGILPLPKIDQAQSGYRSPVTKEMPVFAVPANNSRLSETGLVLQSLNAASYGYLTDEYITYAMNYVVRDNDTLNMIDIIANSASFDFALMFGSGYSALGKATYDALFSSINSKASYRTFYNSYANAAVSQINAAFPVK
ncbi:MAG: hypothetical protein GX303_05230 [Clostridiales bacterium]|nr:hypothetical protein [Clostridiales bacterium]